MTSTCSDDASTSSVTEVVRVRAIDTTFRLEVRSPGIADRLRVEWSRCLVESPVSDEVPVRIEPDGEFGDGSSYFVASRLTRLAVEAAIGRYVMFHACALTDDAGDAVICVAPSGTGKTTAALTLGASGFGYVTDEAVAVTDDGLVVPYPKPLSVVQRSGAKSQHSPDQLGLARCSDAPRLGALVLLSRVPGAVVPRLEPMPLLDAILALIPQTSALPSMDRPIQRLCEVVDRCGGLKRLTYSEIADAGEVLAALLRRDRPATEPWGPLPRASDGPAPRGGTSETLYRADHSDGVQVGDEAVLLVGLRPARLSPVGLTIWQAAEGGATLNTLVDVAVEVHGSHPEADILVSHAVEQMLYAGVLVQGPQAR